MVKACFEIHDEDMIEYVDC